MSKPAVRCESCGMPIELGPYCRHCVDDAGELQPFEERLERLVQFTVRQQGLSREEAEAKAREHMRAMPAWKGHPRLA